MPASTDVSEVPAPVTPTKKSAKGKVAGEASPSAKVASPKAKSGRPKAKAKAKAKAQAVDKTTALSKQTGAVASKGKAKAKAKSKAAAAPLAKASAGKSSAKASGGKSNGDKKKKKAEADPEESAPPKKPKCQGQVKDARQRLLQNAASVLGSDRDDDPEKADSDDEDDDDDENDKASGKGKRDRCKAQKFDQMLAAGKIPTHIVDMLTEGEKDAKKPRKFKTEIINQLFNRDDKGKLIMQPHAPLFQAWKESHEKTKFKHKETALPKSVFLRQVLQQQL